MADNWSMHSAALPPSSDLSLPDEAAIDDPDAAAAASVAPRQLRAALGLFATGVTIVTTLTAEGVPLGMTVNSFNSVSLEPPLVLWSLGLRSGSLPAFRQAQRYVIHVLGADQRALAERFAQRGVDRFASTDWAPGLGDMPVLAGAAAVFECRARSSYDEGDHVILVGQVERCSSRHGAHPLIFHGGRFYTELPL
jgi:flavin reductase (DIM6/NTAB) family NADH-FMN oxidoreductase RutF